MHKIEDQGPPTYPFESTQNLDVALGKAKGKIAYGALLSPAFLEKARLIAESTFPKEIVFEKKGSDFAADLITLSIAPENLHIMHMLLDYYRTEPDPVYLLKAAKIMKDLKNEAIEKDLEVIRPLHKKAKQHIQEKIYEVIKDAKSKNELALDNVFLETKDGLHQASPDKIIDISEIENATARVGLKGGDITAVAVRNKQEAKELKKDNPNIITIILDEEVQAQAEELLQEAVKRYIAHQLELIRNASKKDEETKKGAEHAPSESPFTYHHTSSADKLAHQRSLTEDKATNMDSELALTLIKIVQDIIKASREEKKKRAEIEEKDQIEEKRLKGDILKGERRTRETQQQEIKRTEGHQAQTKGEIEETKKAQSAPPPRPTRE